MVFKALNVACSKIYTVPAKCKTLWELKEVVIYLLLLVFKTLGRYFLAGTTAQSGDRYGSGTQLSGQILRGSLPLLSPDFRRSHFLRQMPPHPHQRERS
jgi:hypothetical protein